MLVGAGALVASTMAMTGPAAQADPGYGTLVVRVVDQYGHLVPGALQVYNANDSSVQTTFDPSDTGRHELSVPVGGYSFVDMSPWGGFECVGVSPCTFGGLDSPTSTLAVATVATGVTTTYTFKSTVPWISGGHTVGSKPSIHLSSGVTALLAQGFPGGVNGYFTRQWLRSSRTIAGATGTSYALVPADGSRPVAARLTPTANMKAIFGQLGVTAQPLTTNAINVTKFVRIKTRTKVNVPKRFKRSEPVTMAITVKPRNSARAKAYVLSGAVMVKIDRFKVRKVLHKGRVLITLPRLAIGKHTIKVTYTGSPYFARSTGTAKVRTTR